MNHKDLVELRSYLKNLGIDVIRHNPSSLAIKHNGNTYVYNVVREKTFNTNGNLVCSGFPNLCKVLGMQVKLDIPEKRNEQQTISLMYSRSSK